jgi:hypothetical protein
LENILSKWKVIFYYKNHIAVKNGGVASGGAILPVRRIKRNYRHLTACGTEDKAQHPIVVIAPRPFNPPEAKMRTRRARNQGHFRDNTKSSNNPSVSLPLKNCRKIGPATQWLRLIEARFQLLLLLETYQLAENSTYPDHINTSRSRFNPKNLPAILASFAPNLQGSP